MKGFITSALAFLICTFHVTAEESFRPEPQNILVELQVVAIPQATALPLVRDLKNANKAETAYNQIQDLLVSGTAKLIDWPMVITHSDQRAVAGATNEFRYATQFEAGSAGIYLTNPDGQLVKQPTEIKGVDLQTVPTAFETRDIGVTLEVLPTLSPDLQTIHLQITAQHVRLKAMNKVTVENESTHQKATVEQPEFDAKRVNTSMTVTQGLPTLIGTFKTSEPQEDHLELFILKAEARKTQ